MKKIRCLVSCLLALGVLVSCEAPITSLASAHARDLYPASVQNLQAQTTVVNLQGADTVTVTWTNPVDPAFSANLVVRYSNVPATGKPADGTVYNIGQGAPELGTGAVVAYTNGTSFSEKVGYAAAPGTVTYQVWPMNTQNQYNSTAPSVTLAVAQNEWADVGAPGFSGGFSNQASMVFLPGLTYVSYLDQSVPNAIVVSKYDGVSWSAAGPPIATNGTAYRPMMKVFQGQPHIVYVDGAGSVNVKKFNGASWVSVGAANFGNAVYSAALATDGPTLYVAFYGNSGVNNAGHLMKFNGASWVSAAPDFYSHASPSKAVDNICLAAFQGAVTVAYQSQDAGFVGAYVKNWNGMFWTTLGGASVTTALVNNLSLGLDTLGTPHLLSVEDPQNPIAYARKYSKTANNWVTLGSWPTQGVQATITCEFRIPTVLIYQSAPVAGMYAKQLLGSGWYDLGTVAMAGNIGLYPAFGLNGYGNGKPMVAGGNGPGTKMTVRAFDPWK